MRALSMFAVLMLLACEGSDSPDGSGECNVTASTECEHDTTYEDVEPILQERCVSCHGGMPGQPWSLTTREHVASWASEVGQTVETCTMPPPDAGIAMPNEEREIILDWVSCGAP